MSHAFAVSCAACLGLRQLWQGSSQKVTNQLLSCSERPQVLRLLELCSYWEEG